jgi:hypothetical protein
MRSSSALFCACSALERGKLDLAAAGAALELHEQRSHLVIELGARLRVRLVGALQLLGLQLPALGVGGGRLERGRERDVRARHALVLGALLRNERRLRLDLAIDLIELELLLAPRRALARQRRGELGAARVQLEQQFGAPLLAGGERLDALQPLLALRTAGGAERRRRRAALGLGGVAGIDAVDGIQFALQRGTLRLGVHTAAHGVVALGLELAARGVERELGALELGEHGVESDVLLGVALLGQIGTRRLQLAQAALGGQLALGGGDGVDELALRGAHTDVGVAQLRLERIDTRTQRRFAFARRRLDVETASLGVLLRHQRVAGGGLGRTLIRNGDVATLFRLLNAFGGG